MVEVVEIVGDDEVPSVEAVLTPVGEQVAGPEPAGVIGAAEQVGHASAVDAVDACRGQFFGAVLVALVIGHLATVAVEIGDDAGDHVAWSAFRRRQSTVGVGGGVHRNERIRGCDPSTLT